MVTGRVGKICAAAVSGPASITPMTVASRRTCRLIFIASNRRLFDFCSSADRLLFEAQSEPLLLRFKLDIGGSNNFAAAPRFVANKEMLRSHLDAIFASLQGANAPVTGDIRYTGGCVGTYEKNNSPTPRDLHPRSACNSKGSGSADPTGAADRTLSGGR